MFSIGATGSGLLLGFGATGLGLLLGYGAIGLGLCLGLGYRFRITFRVGALGLGL